MVDRIVLERLVEQSMTMYYERPKPCFMDTGYTAKAQKDIEIVKSIFHEERPERRRLMNIIRESSQPGPRFHFS